ncbi:hypothetical protein M408DRAFT_296599 [Serendipita vermifera MAFF 305830]|uniref:Uncharacterized protein n=1 Tax=Serendipita vermifera MAFF 305830 TaxID=933852 RepID=A0A0C3BDT7_SERVB|nr:hypothetical protein M408DRAFT_296599 [Serendipita vermifera MAFF 305830]
MLWIIGSVTQDILGTPCPTLNNYTKTGVSRTDNGILILKFSDAYGGNDISPLRVFVSHMDLKLNLPNSSQGLATASSSDVTAS